MHESANLGKTKTWDGLRGLFVLMAVVFLGILGWLIFHESFLEKDARPLLLVPFGCFLGSLLTAIFASDQLLGKLSSWLVSW